MDTKLRKLVDYKYSFSKDNKVTICEATYFHTDPNYPDYESYIYTKGITICDNNDILNTEIGKKVARAKCDLQAYQEYKRRLKSAIVDQIDKLHDLESELYKIKSCIAHQKAYLNQF
jgi:hypothetical protein